jgi:hypothetical protein
LASKAPSPLLEVSYSPESQTTTKSHYRPPADVATDDSEQLIRIGLYEPKTKRWTGVVTRTSAFQAGQASTATLHLDEKGDAQHVSFRSSSVQQQTGGSEQVSALEGIDTIQVRLETARAGPEPHVNKPVMVDADGKEPVVEVQKSLLQR